MVKFTHHDAGTSAGHWAAGGLPGLPELPLDAAGIARTQFLVLAAHPDDESLGAGGLLARLQGLGAGITVLLCTAGEASHPGSPTTTPDRLAAVRLEEFAAALAQLRPAPDPAGAAADWRYLGLPDGNLAGHREQIRMALADAVGAVGNADTAGTAGTVHTAGAAGTGRSADRIIVVAPYRHDGHTDHETLGSVAAEFCTARGYGLLEYPIWYWQWAGPDDEAWRTWFRLPLSPVEQQAKAAAMASHGSQIRALSPLPGDEVLLHAAFLEHFERPWETYAWQRPEHSGPPGPAYAAADAETVFDAVHRRGEDPWNYTSSWYEQRKRALTLAALPEPAYAAGLEIGCSIGTLSADLAQRCGTFLAVDASSAALEHAAARLGPFPAARTRQLTVPQDWPDGTFDLIVVSEVGYYLAPRELAALFDRVAGSLRPGGTLLLCHWRHPIDGWELDGDAVHAAARRRGWADAGLYRERDFVLEVLRAPDAGAAAVEPDR